MAEENLGKAVLRIEVDDKPARNALKLLRQDIENVSVSKGTQSSISKQTKSERDLEVIKEKRFRLARRIEALEDKGVNVSRLRTQLGRLTTAYAERDFTLARNTARELARQATLAERTEKRRARAARSAKAEADESIRSARGLNRVNIDGSLRDVGSPRFVTRGARQGGQAESINALTAAQKRRYSLDQQIRSLEASGVRTDQLRVRLGEVTTAQANRQFGTFNRLADTLDFTLRKERDKLKVLQDQNREYERIGKLNVAPVRGGVAFPGSPAALEAQQREGLRTGRLNAAPVRGGKAFPGSPAFLDSIFPSFPKEYFAKQAREVKAASQKQQGIISNAIIGGAFPLLFGQGIGASIGGAAGGAAGGAIGGQFGFGLSLVGTALGSQFDVAIQKSGELAKALDNPIAQFGALQQNALLSSKGLEKQIQSLIASGREAEAAALIQEDLNKLFGDAEGAKEYQNAVDRLNRSYSQATVILANFVAGPLANLINGLTQPYKEQQVLQRFLSARDTLNPEQRKQVQAFDVRRRREQGIGIFASESQRIEQYLALLEEINRVQGKNSTALLVAARNQKILTQSAQTLVGLEAAINRARISGNKPLEESITLQQELLKNYRERKLIEQQLAAGSIKAPKATERTRQSFAEDVTLQQNYVNSTRQSAANAVKELQTTKQLSGLEGVRLEVARKRLEIDEAANAAYLQRTEFINAREKLSAQPTNLNRVLAQGAFQELVTAGVQFETKLRQAADYLVKAAKDAAQNLTTAILNLGKLEADPAGLNRFLTPNEQFESTRKAILRLGTGADGSSQLENAITKATELLGLTRGQANERFQGLRDIFAQARQGVFASQEGFNTLSSFIEDTRAREQAVTGLDDAQKTLTDVTALSASVQQELVGAVRENSVLLNSLFGKDWNVNVSVSGAEANVSGDAVNRQLSP